MSSTGRFSVGFFALHSALTALVTYGIASQFGTMDSPVPQAPAVLAGAIRFVVYALALSLTLPLDRALAVDLMRPEPLYLLLNSAVATLAAAAIFWTLRGRHERAA